MAARSQDVIYRYRLWPTRGFDFVNEAVTHIIGYTPAEHYADPGLALRVIHPGDRYLAEERLRLGPTPDTIVLRWKRKDGGTIWMEQRETPILGPSGRLVAIEGVARRLADPTRGADAAVRLLDGVRVDLVGQKVHVDGQFVSLSPTEFKLLAVLTGHPGKVFTREELMRSLWHSTHTGDSHACETYISSLRKKIERDPRFPERILTVRGQGYSYASS